MAAIGLQSTAIADRRLARWSVPGRADRRVSLLSSPQAAALIAEWRDLARRGSDDNVFFHPGVLLPAIDHLDDGVRIAVARDDQGRMIALAPVQAVRLGHLAPALRLFVHREAPLGTPLVDAEHLAAGAALIADTLPGDGSLVVPSLALDGPVARALIAAADRAGRPVATVGAHARAALRRDETDVRDRLSRHRRKEYARQMRRLGDRGPVMVETTAEADRVRARLEEFLVLEAAGWKGRRGTALASSAATAAFARDVVFNRSERGSVRIASIRVGEHPVAIVVGFVAGGTAYVWKIAHDEAFARYSPGAQLMLDVAESLFFDPAVAIIDSCAPAGDPTVDDLWRDRLSIGTLVIGPPGGSLLHTAGLAVFKAEAEAADIARRLRARL
jgi:CelD/BcsL family acetyltransferase involved in cellulose biosynthesis